MLDVQIEARKSKRDKNIGEMKKAREPHRKRGGDREKECEKKK